MTITYEKLNAILDGVCLAQCEGPANSHKRILNSIRRSAWRWMGKDESWEDYFVRVVMTREYRSENFMMNCRNFGKRSAEVLDEVRAIAIEWAG